MTPRKTKSSAARRAVPVKAPKPVKRKPAQANSIALKVVAPAAKYVAIAGSFNNWQPTPLATKPTKAGEWKSELKLAPGRYEYLFVIDGKWVPDPAAPDVVPNPFGGINSVLSVS
jgi:1,4-alpha-glucan branching enzyme